MSEVRLSELIGPAYYGMHHAIRRHDYTHYWLKGGRGSLKSSFVSVEIILGMMKSPDRHAICFRKIKDTLSESVYEQLLWAIDMLGVSEYWQKSVSPMRLTYKPTGQRILFRGLDYARKLKSIKARNGYFAYVWYEELDEFRDMDEIAVVNQSVLRGGRDFWVFYSFNPPKSKQSWVNYEATVERADKAVLHTTYLTAPAAWLGEQFLVEAEHKKQVNYDKYRHEFLGEAIGTGGEVFTNVEARAMTDEEIAAFDRIRAGLDWGWSIDPLAYVEMQWDKTRKTLYIFHEKYGLKISNSQIAAHIKARGNLCTVKCDSAEGKSIAELQGLGVRAVGATKGRGSVERGMRYLTDEIEHIYIDPARCPNTYREFVGYELDQDRNGNFKSDYPDRDNHTIDAVRYALEESAVRAKRSNLY